MITVIDYGLGNIRAFCNLYERLNITTRIARVSDDLKGATKIILPGVGSFDYAMQLLNASGMREELEKMAFSEKVPLLGICVGMQILAKSSEEGILPGLGWIDGEVKRFDQTKITFKTKLPHMGWNTISPENNNPFLNGFDSGSRFYFLHSYYFKCNYESDVIARSQYGQDFASVINHSNIFGVQFHPEKSHSDGIRLLNNFARL